MLKTTPHNLHLPIGALVFAGLAVIIMVAWSVTQWPDMAATIVTREAGGNHGESVVPREVTAAAMPALLAILTVLLAIAPSLEARMLQRFVTSPQRDRGRGEIRVLGAFLVGVSVLLSALHVGFVSMFTGADLPIEKIAPVAVGVLLTIIGIYLPLARPSTSHTNEWLESFRAAQGPYYRVGGFALVVVGIATSVCGLTVPWLSMIIAILGVIVIFGGIAVAAGIKTLRA